MYYSIDALENINISVVTFQQLQDNPSFQVQEQHKT